MKKKSFVVITIILCLVIVGLCIFITYDKNLFNIRGEKFKISDETEKNGSEGKDVIKDVDIDSDLVKELVYPTLNSYYDGTYLNGFILKNESVELYTRDDKILSAVDRDDLFNSPISKFCNVDSSNNLVGVSDKPENDGIQYTSCSAFDEEKIQQQYLKLFGPDDKYESGSLSKMRCALPSFYDDDTKMYYGINACGGVPPLYSSVLKTYKVEQKGDYLYIYDYALITLDSNEIDGIVLFDNYITFQQFEGTSQEELVIVQTKEDAQTKLEEKINDNTVNTYVWTFKKQSDGHYYYYSSKWLDN